MTDWRPLGAVSPGALGSARAELHWAATAVEQVGRTLVEPAEDHSHRAFRWSDELQALVTAPASTGARAALRPASGAFLAIDAGGDTVDSWTLAHRTLEQAAGWMRARFEALTGEEPEWAPLRDEGLPPSEVGRGGVFSEAGAGHHELGRWFGNAAAVLAPICEARPEAGPLLCWPHHFDIATRLDFEPESDPEEARSVGLGLSPGDEDAPEPYFYALPWPEPDSEARPALPGPGEWVANGFVGARLLGSELVGIDGASQHRVADAFLRGALDAAREILGL